MIYYLSPGDPQGQVSGGLRKLYDHVAILNANGLEARAICQPEVEGVSSWHPEDLAVLAEVWGDGMRHAFPFGVRRVAFIQNGYLLWHQVAGRHADEHPLMTTPELVAVLAISDHTVDQIRDQLPSLPVPVIRVHPSVNAPELGEGTFTYGPWPRNRTVAYFAYKNEDIADAVFSGLELPQGWRTVRMENMTYQEVEDTLRSSAIFAAPLRREGFCGTTAEAMISGAMIVAWPGGPPGQREIGGPMEYLRGRAELAIQDDVADLRRLIAATAARIDRDPELAARSTREWSEWFQAAYSREAEVDEICSIMERLTAVPKGL